MPKFKPTPQIFTAETALHHNAYEPNEFPARETEETDYMAALQPVINGAPPKHIFLKGKPGTGKTSMTKHLLAHLEEDAQTYNIDVTSLYVNLDTNKGTSSYQAAVQLVNKARELRHGPGNYKELKNRGYSESEVYDYLFKELNTFGGIVIVVLDEVHQLTDTQLLYHLPRARSMEKLNTDTHVGIIGISNDPQYLRNLDPEVKDTLTQETILFHPYSATQLEGILYTRADTAFHSDALDEGVIRLCAALAAQRTGSAREAIDLLREAGELARKHSHPTVTTQHVRDADIKLEEDIAKASLQALTIQEKNALLALANQTAISNDPVPTSNVYEEYLAVIEIQDGGALSENRFADRLKSLEQQRLISSELDATGGRQHIYYLETSYPLLLDAFDSLTRYRDVLTQLLRNLQKHKHVTLDEIEHLDTYQSVQ